jgi:NAD(P)-dependent dehydrogenase (short-subunit alcohol dehydrogenase family)
MTSPLEPDLSGRAALVAGGTGGIGGAIRDALVACGVRVVTTSRRRAQTARLDDAVMHVQADLSSEGGAKEAVDVALRRLGTLDIFVHAIGGTWHQAAVEIDTASWLKTIDTNVSSCMWMCRSVARHFKDRGHGSILIVGSTSLSTPLGSEAAYRASKAALKAYMEVLAIELAPFGIRVNMLTPGAVATGFVVAGRSEARAQVLRHIPLRREALPGELAPAAILLLSDRLSPYTTGTDLVIDGGLSLGSIPVSGGGAQQPGATE